MRRFGSIVLVAALATGAAWGQESTSGEDRVTSVRTAEIPELDRDLPKKLETATFALG